MARIRLYAGYVLAYLLTGISTVVFSQNSPVLKQQVNFELGIDEVVPDYKSGTFLVKAGDSYTLVDQFSKIQLGTIQLDAGGWGAPGVGKVAAWKNGSFLLSTAFALLEADPVTKTVDTFFNAVQFPEVIENFIPWPGNENMVLIATKIYTLKKDKTISYLDENDNYEGCTNCRWILYDAAKKTIVKSVNMQQYITAFAPAVNNQLNIIAGTFYGDIIEIDTALHHTVKLHAFDTGVHSVVTAGGYIIAAPQMQPLYIGQYGGDAVYLFNENGQAAKVIPLKKQEIKKDETKDIPDITPEPSASVFRMFATSNAVYVNYGFSGLLEIKLTGFETAEYNITYPMAKFFCLNKDGNQLLGATDVAVNLFATARKQELFDLKSRKFQPAFRQYAKRNEFKTIYKTFDEEGNYHIIGHKETSWSDTIVVFSSNRTEPAVFACEGCEFKSKDNYLTILSGNRSVYGKLQLTKIRQAVYNFSFYKQDEELFKPEFSTEKTDGELLPYPVRRFEQVNSSAYLITGDDVVIITDTSGKIIFNKKVSGKTTGSELCAFSPSKKWLVILEEDDFRHEMSVWNWQENKKIFSKKHDKGVDIAHFTFDKTKDVIWFAQQWYDNGNFYGDVYSMNLDEASPKPKKEFSDDSYFSFEVDMGNDLIASESYNEIKLAKLSTRKVLWKNSPSQSFITVHQQPQGFAFSSEKEFHAITPRMDYLYFTSFAGNKPVEVVNGYLYRGDKSAINNLAFVFDRKGYLPSDYDIYFNRPDTVIQVSGSANTEFNILLAEAVAKRKRRNSVSSLAELLTNAPACTVINKADIPDVVSAKEIKLKINTHKAHKIHITVNGVPVYGKAGRRLPETDPEAVLSLEKGVNVIQVYAEDATTGAYSPTETISVTGDFETEQPKTYFIGIGIDKFADSAHNLSYSVKDIRDLTGALREKLGSSLVVVDTLFNKNVTRENVLKLKDKLYQAGVNDKVIISYSGHGLLNKEYDYYLSTYAIDFKTPEKAGLAYSGLEYLLDSIKPRKKLLLIDACHSGEVDKEEMARMKNLLRDTSFHLVDGSKSGGGMELIPDESATGMKNSFELMQEIFAGVGKGTGSTVLSAAAGTQFAYEKGALKNGVFTYCILKLLKEKPTCSMQELKSIVSAEVERLTQGAQKPTSRAETTGFDWKVW